MNCRNCGAPMELFAARRYFFCGHCGTFEFPDIPAVNGVQVLERPASPRPCPLCASPLATSLLDEAHVIEHCERCRGILLPRSTFSEAVARRRARERGEPAPPVPLDPRELKRRLTCPGCGQPMDVHPYYGPGNVIIDSCSRCNLIWLDFGELKQITEAAGKDRGRVAPDAAPEPRRHRHTLLDIFEDFE